MGLFGLFKKKDDAPEFTKRSDIRRKKFDFNYTDAEQLNIKMKRDVSVIVGLSPSNYYASKSKYTQALFYYMPDYSYIMVKLDSYVDDKIEASTEYFTTDFDTLQKLCGKFGQHI